MSFADPDADPRPNPREILFRPDQSGSDRFQRLSKSGIVVNISAGSDAGRYFHCLFDEPLTLLQTSDSFLQLTGYTREEIRSELHNSFRALIDPRDLRIRSPRSANSCVMAAIRNCSFGCCAKTPSRSGSWIKAAIFKTNGGGSISAAFWSTSPNPSELPRNSD